MSEKRKDNKNRILKTGESQRKDNSYQYRYKDSKGTTHYVYARSLDKLREKEAEVQRAFLDGINYHDGEATVNELLERYTRQKQGVRYNTLVGYEFVKNLAKKEDFGYRKIKTIKQSDARAWFIKLQNENGYKRSTISSVRGVVRPAFRLAVDDGMIKTNPFDFALSGVVKNDEEKRKALTRDEVSNLLEFIRAGKCRSRYYDEIVILLGTGLRISELCGLTIADIDFKSKDIRVERQLSRTRSGEYYIQKPKTERGNRVVPMSDEVEQAFRRVLSNRKIPQIEPLIDGYSGFVFLDKDSRPKVAGHLEHAMKRIVDKYNEEHAIQIKANPHVLRHTFCTDIVQNEIGIKNAQYIMGHSDVQTTLNIYAHCNQESAKTAFNKVVASL